MPFDIFRRHQRKLLAVFAILAMFGFVLSDSLPALIGGRSGSGATGKDPIVAKLSWKTLHASDLEPMRVERQRANFFFSRLDNRTPQFFGSTSVRDLVDAVILEHEADKLGLPANIELANRWLRNYTGGVINPQLFERIYRESALPDQISAEGLLTEIANQIRIQSVRVLPLAANYRTIELTAGAEVTPLDVFQSYRDQEERVSAYAVAVNVEDYLSKVGEPTEADILQIYDSYKNTLPNPLSPDPGFLEPQKVQFEYATADVAALARTLRPKITEQDLKDAYNLRKEEFRPLPPGPGDLPHTLFANAPDLTPHDEFPEVRDLVLERVSEEKARDEVTAKFDTIRDTVMRPFSDSFYGVDSDSKKPSDPDRKPGSLLKDAALKNGLTFESTPMVSRLKLDLFGPIGESKVGIAPFGQGQPFSDLAFSTRATLFEPFDLVDDSNRRYLAWKVEEKAPRVPAIDEVRAEIVRAWKIRKARPLAEKEAKLLSDRTVAAGGGEAIKAVADKRPVIITDSRTKIQPPPRFGERTFGVARDSEIPELLKAGNAVRNAIYGLEPKTSAVAPNDPITVYYILSLRTREDADLDRLYAAGMSSFMYREVTQEVASKRLEEWRNELRRRSGLPADWAPPSEFRNSEDVADSQG